MSKVDSRNAELYSFLKDEKLWQFDKEIPLKAQTRIDAIKCFAENFSCHATSMETGFSHTTIRAWIKIFKAKGVQGIVESTYRKYNDTPVVIQEEGFLNAFKEVVLKEQAEKGYMTIRMAQKILAEKFEYDCSVQWIGVMMHRMDLRPFHGQWIDKNSRLLDNLKKDD